MDTYGVIPKQQAVVAESAAFPGVLTKAQAALDEAIAYFSAPTLPSYVPPPGKFANFTLNTPAEGVPVGYERLSASLTHWTGGDLVRDYGPHGALCYFGGGEHGGWRDWGGVLLLDVAARKYTMRCRPSWQWQWCPGWAGIGVTTGAIVNGNAVQLPLSDANFNLIPLAHVGSHAGTWLCLDPASNNVWQQFKIVAKDLATKTVTLEVAPSGITTARFAISWYTGPPTDEFGGMLPDGYPSRRHQYNGFAEMPAAWDGGPKGSLILIHSGGMIDKLIPRSTQGYFGKAAAWKFDLNNEVGGVTRLTGNNNYYYDKAGVVPARTNDAPSVAIDYKRRGWWSKERAGGNYDQARTCFTSHDGKITSFPLLQGHSWAAMHVLEDEDLLVLIAGYNSANASQGTFLTIPPIDLQGNPQTGAQWKKVAQAGLEQAIAPYAVPTDPAWIGYMGMRWCPHPNYQCFIGMPNYARLDDTHVRLLLLTPPPLGQRFTGTWQWTHEVAESHDGSIMRQGVTSAPYDHGIQNGSFGKLVYCEPLRSLVWTRSTAAPGQLIRLPRMD